MNLIIIIFSIVSIHYSYLKTWKKNLSKNEQKQRKTWAKHKRNISSRKIEMIDLYLNFKKYINNYIF